MVWYISCTTLKVEDFSYYNHCFASLLSVKLWINVGALASATNVKRQGADNET